MLKSQKVDLDQGPRILKLMGPDTYLMFRTKLYVMSTAACCRQTDVSILHRVVPTLTAYYTYVGKVQYVPCTLAIKAVLARLRAWQRPCGTHLETQS